ncbi:MAG: hypothetical protein H0V09_06555 [Gemmatimonadetes bacterium]|nr:hypothetical protein [Gemmatimonadota bacterium]
MRTFRTSPRPLPAVLQPDPSGMGARALRRAASLGSLLAVFAAAGCSGDGTGPDEVSGLRDAAIVVNSLGGTLSFVGREREDGPLVAVNDAVELGPGANAVTLAIGEESVVVPVGGTDSLLVFAPPSSGEIARRCAAALPAGSSPNGVVIAPGGFGGGGSAAAGDAFVSLLLSGEVARVDLGTCQVEAIAVVGAAPADLEVVGDELVVVVSNLDLSGGGFPVPRLGEGFVAVLDPLTLAIRDTFGTGGFNPQFATVDREGDLLVVNSGDFGAGNGSLSVLDVEGGRRTAGPFPLGDFPADLAMGPDNRAYVTSFSEGLYVFDATANVVLRGAGAALAAPPRGEEVRGSSGVSVNEDGEVLSVFFNDGVTPGTAFLFDAQGALVDSVGVGLGPFSARFVDEARFD